MAGHVDALDDVAGWNFDVAGGNSGADFVLDENYMDLPNSGSDMYLAQKGQALDVYRWHRLCLNSNYLIANRSQQILGSGNNNADYGTFASVVTDSWMKYDPHPSSIALVHRGRSIVWPPHFRVDVRLDFNATAATGDGGRVDLYVSPEPWGYQDGADVLADPPRIPAGFKTDYADVTETASLETCYIEIDNAPVGRTGMIYFYLLLNNISKMGSWCFYRKPLTDVG